MSYQHQNTLYEITIENPDEVTHGVILIELDGNKQQNSNGIPLLDDGQSHQVRLVLGQVRRLSDDDNNAVKWLSVH